MFESSRRLSAEVLELLEAVRGLGGGRYACVVEPKGILFESPEPEDREAWALRRFLEEKCAALFAIPKALADGAAMDDAFEGWHEDEFFLAPQRPLRLWWPARRRSPAAQPFPCEVFHGCSA